MSQNSYQKDKHQGFLPCKILGTIIKVGEGWTLTNKPEYKKILDDA